MKGARGSFDMLLRGKYGAGVRFVDEFRNKRRKKGWKKLYNKLVKIKG